MHNTKILSFAVAACLGIIAFTGSPVGAAGEKQSTKISLSVQQAAHFDQALAALSEASHRAVVAEGRPLHDTLDATQAKPLLDAHTPAQAWEAFCRAYDYEIITPTEGGTSFPDVIALRKRYSHSNDLPGVTPDECLLALKEVQRLMRSANGGTPLTDRSKIIQDAFDSIPPERWLQLATGGIPIRELSPYQRECFRRITLYFYLSRESSALDGGQRLLSSCHRFSLTSIKQNQKDVVMVTGKDRIGGWRHPLKGLVPSVMAVNTSRDDLSKQEAILAMPTNSVLLLKSAATQTGVHTQVHEALADKPVSVAGSQRAAPSHLIKALAAVYGLKATSAALNEWEIKPSTVRSDRNLATVYMTVKRVLPLPLVRATEPVDLVSRLKTGDATRLHLSSRNFASERNLITTLEHRPGDIMNECQNRLEVLYAARAKGKTGYTVSLDELGPEAQQCFAVLIMAGIMDSIRQVSQRGGPAYLLKFDESVAIGGEEGSAGKWVGLGMARPLGAASPMIKMSVFK